MAAISQTINNVLGGVSQQPDPVKLPGQVKEAVNVTWIPPSDARSVRAPEFIANLGIRHPLDAKWFPIFRDKERALCRLCLPQWTTHCYVSAAGMPDRSAL